MVGGKRGGQSPLAKCHWNQPACKIQASLPPPGYDVPLQSHGPEPGAEHMEATKDALQANQEHCLSQAAKKRRI